MSRYLFVYGTLDPEHAPSEIAPTVAKLRRVGSASVQGVLYDLGEYPGAVLTGQPKRKIPGTVFRIPDDPEVLQQLDEYEGFAPSNRDGSLFVRKVRPVKMANGQILRCWVYTYNRPPGTARVISGRSHRGKRLHVRERRRAAS